jgi:hypothetical protein
MGYLAFIDENNYVINVIKAAPDFDPSGIECAGHVNPGYLYNEDTGKFYPPRPYPSWIMQEDEETGEITYVPPVDPPENKDDSIYHEWDEASQTWAEYNIVEAGE